METLDFSGLKNQTSTLVRGWNYRSRRVKNTNLRLGTPPRGENPLREVIFYASTPTGDYGELVEGTGLESDSVTDNSSDTYDTTPEAGGTESGTLGEERGGQGGVPKV